MPPSRAWPHPPTPSPCSHGASSSGGGHRGCGSVWRLSRRRLALLLASIVLADLRGVASPTTPGGGDAAFSAGTSSERSSQRVARPFPLHAPDARPSPKRQPWPQDRRLHNPSPTSISLPDDIHGREPSASRAPPGARPFPCTPKWTSVYLPISNSSLSKGGMASMRNSGVCR